MNKNILSPKGTIDQTLFIIYYLILTAIYIFGGLLLIIIIYKNNLNSLYFMWPLLIIKILIAFNYKKRIKDITQNLPLSILLGFILTFDTECLVACKMIKDDQVSTILFFIFGIFILLIQPAIVALIPGKDNKQPNAEEEKIEQTQE